jgi:putative OmpL-like beta-barrel porin-2
MKSVGRVRGLVVALVCGLAVLSFPAPLAAEENDKPAASQMDAAALQRLADLEQEVERLRQELQAVRGASVGAAILRPAVYAPQDGSASAAAPAAAAAPATPAPAAQKPDPLAGLSSVLGGATVVGLVDGYYGYNFNKPAAGGTALSGAPGDFTSLRLFDPRNNQFALNLVELGLVKTPDADNRLGYKAIFGFGDAMQQVNVVSGGDPSFLQYLKEAYFSYLAPVGKGLLINVGKFVTPNGAEVIESNANWNYSRSLLFNYAIPFYHYGVQAQYTFNPKFTLTGYVVNGWNDIIHDTSTGYHNSGKTGGLTFAWTATKKLTLTENWMGGPGATQLDGSHWRNLFDTVVAYNLNSKWSFQLNGDYGRVERTTLTPLSSVDWWGAAGYVKYQINPKYAFATRYEYYNDPNGYTTGIFDANGHGPHIQEVTLTMERRIATHLISRLEYRHDESNQAFFPKGQPSNPPVSGQNTMAVGMMFVLEPNEANK